MENRVYLTAVLFFFKFSKTENGVQQYREAVQNEESIDNT